MNKTNSFKRRYYHSLSAMLQDTRAIFSQRKQIRGLMHDNLISETFRERIMLTVTEVNGCRYCQYAHAKMALDAGLTDSEIDALADGIFHHCPPEEVPALLYAQHWAEADGNPDPQTRQQIIEIYGKEATEAMDLAMRMIRMGNLMGNTWDYILYRISFGHWGNSDSEQPQVN